MLVRFVDKQRHAVNIVKTALLSAGITGRAVYVQVDSGWAQYEGENYSVFVSAPAGANTEPFFITGKTLVEVVKNMLNSIKTEKHNATTEVSEIAPF